MKKKTYYGIFFLILFSIGLWMIPNVHGIFFPPDEYGYWANAAALWGCDWTEVNRLNMYYSYGYSMVLLPILEIGEEAAKLLNGSIQSAPIYSYRIAIGVNILFVWFHGVILWKISEHLFPKMNEKRRSIICICAACYPSVLVYMHYTLAEVALNLVFLILVWQVIRYAEALKIQHKRKAYLEAVKLAVIAGFLYIVHMRTIGIWAALGIVLCVDAFFIKNEKNLGIEKDNQNNRDAWNTQKRGAIIFLLTSLILFLGAELVKDLLQKQLYGNTALDIISLNDYSGRFGAVMRLFSISGLVDFAVSCAGKLFYLGNTTFGLYYFAVFLLWRKCREEKKQEKIVWYFLLGAVVFNFGISALATAGPGRVDALIYGRYNETIMPVMVCLGLIEIVKQTGFGKRQL